MNETLKKKYIETRSKKYESTDTIAQAFKKFEPYEEDFNKDLCMFDVLEIHKAYTGIHSRSFESLSNIHSQVLAYATWCMSYGKRYFKDELKGYKSNYYAALHTDDIHRMMGNAEANRIITRKELLDKCKRLPNASDAFILLCLFEGLKGKDYSEIREIIWDDFKGNKLTIHPGRISDLYGDIIPPERTITVSDELIYYADKARKETNYKALVNISVLTPLSTEPYIVKRTQKASNCDVQPKLTRRIVEILSYKKDIDDPDLSASDIRNSGKVYYLNQIIKQKKKDSYSVVFGSEYQEICERFDDNIQRQTFWNKYQSRLVSYAP